MIGTAACWTTFESKCHIRLLEEIKVKIQNTCEGKHRGLAQFSIVFRRQIIAYVGSLCYRNPVESTDSL